MWFSPNGERNTTDSILSAGHGRTAQSCSIRRRTESRMSDGYRSAPERLHSAVCHHATSGAKPSIWSFSFWSRLSGINTGRYTFSYACLFKTFVKICLDILPPARSRWADSSGSLLPLNNRTVSPLDRVLYHWAKSSSLDVIDCTSFFSFAIFLLLLIQYQSKYVLSACGSPDSHTQT